MTPLSPAQKLTYILAHGNVDERRAVLSAITFAYSACAERNPGVDVRRGSAESLPFDDGGFDAARPPAGPPQAHQQCQAAADMPQHGGQQDQPGRRAHRVERQPLMLMLDPRPPVVGHKAQQQQRYGKTVKGTSVVLVIGHAHDNL